MSFTKAVLSKAPRIAAVAVLAGAALGVTDVENAFAGTSSGHLMVSVDSSDMVSARINGVCYNNLAPNAWTQTEDSGTFSGTIAVYNTNNCPIPNLLGEDTIPRDTSSLSNYWYTIHKSNLSAAG